MTVTRQNIAAFLVDMPGLDHKTCKGLVDTFFDRMREVLASGEPLLLSGFGRFDLRDKRERPGRNPRSNEPFQIKARRVVTFRASNPLRQRCNPGWPIVRQWKQP